MVAAVEKAQEITNNSKDAVMLQQFNNPANSAVHMATTGPEIWRDTAGKVDIVVCGIGTGGTITGVGEYLKSKNPKIQVQILVSQLFPSTALFMTIYATPAQALCMHAARLHNILTAWYVDSCHTTEEHLSAYMLFRCCVAVCWCCNGAWCALSMRKPLFQVS